MLGLLLIPQEKHKFFVILYICYFWFIYLFIGWFQIIFIQARSNILHM